MNYEWENEIALTGLTLSPSDFPRMVVPIWEINNKKPSQYKARWEFVLLKNTNHSFAIESEVGNGVDLDSIPKGLIADRVLIGSNIERKEEGKFKLYLSLIDSRGNPVPLLSKDNITLTKCDLGEVNIIFTKTRLIFNFLTGKQKDFILAAQGIFTLLN